MDIDSYFSMLTQEFYKAYDVASKARAKGLDPHSEVEIKPAPDLASRVEGLIGIEGISELIRSKGKELSRNALAFEMVKEICTNKRFDGYETIKRIELAVRIGLAIATEGVLVAPTEGMSGVKHYKNQDNTDYVAVVYAGPIRGAGGTAAALSVAFADYARKFFNIGAYKPTQEEIERYVEEVELYNRVKRLQFKPTEKDLRTIVSNCPVCVDGLPTEDEEINVHKNIKRIDENGKEVKMSTRIRGGVPLVLCEGVAQKAKKLLKEVKAVGLDWSWLNEIIKVEKTEKDSKDKDEKTAVFLEELVAGRPIFAYPKLIGGFRLRYGRSRFTGIAAKGFSPATMIIGLGFIATGTQLKVELPGKGCVAMPVDSIEGPFVKLRSGECLRINDAEKANELKDEVVEIISLGDILITFGDFKKSNTPLQPTSYVEELWELELEKAAGNKINVNHKSIGFKEAYDFSIKYGIPIHPKFLFEFQAIDINNLEELSKALIRNAEIEGNKETLFGIERIKLDIGNNIRRVLELLQVPYSLSEGKVVLEKEYAQSLVASLGFASANGSVALDETVLSKYPDSSDIFEVLNKIAPFRIVKRSTFIGGRIGRPEKAKERLMKPAPNVLFPIGEYGGKDRNITKAYTIDSKKLGTSNFKVDIARYKCTKCKRIIDTPYCYDCEAPAVIERMCPKCGVSTFDKKCNICGSDTVASEERAIDVAKVVTNALSRLGIAKMPNVVKGVRGLSNRDKVAENIEKGILRSMHNVFIFKDGTARFDATDAPITHFYPKECGTSVEKLRQLGYDKDYLGNDLTSEEQLVELRHQDVIINKKGAEYMLRVAQFMDDLLERYYGIEKFYNAHTTEDLIGHYVITLSPHTSCGVLGRIIGFTEANVGLAHPYTISARRRNCDGDEDTTMLLLDALVNFSKEYLTENIGGTMDAPLILTLNVMPEDVDDEVHAMEIVDSYGLDFYSKTNIYAMPGDLNTKVVGSVLGSKERFDNLKFTHDTSYSAIANAPKRSAYTQFGNMHDKVEAEFKLIDMLDSVNKKDVARKLILSHFIPDLIGNMHSFSKQMFRCSVCNAKYRRVPLSGKCMKDGGKLLLTISKGGIEKYLNLAIMLADRYDVEPYIKQRLQLVKKEIKDVFGMGKESVLAQHQFNLSKFM